MATRDVTRETVLVRNAGLPSAPLGANSVAVLNAAQDHYYGLDNVSARIWELLESPISIAALEAALRAEYEVSEQQLTAELRPFLAQLLDEGIVVVGRPDAASGL